MPLISISSLGGDLADKYVLSTLRDIWLDMGLQVEVGKEYAKDADLCILHHDLTRLDPFELPAAPKGVPVLNGRVLDISKRRYSSLRVLPGDAWDGPVIVKSDLNAFGGPERSRAGRLPLLQRGKRRLAKIDWRLARMLPKKTYPVLNSIKQVPTWVWGRDDLLVERFMPERVGKYYCQRGYLFFGEASYGYRIYSTHPTVKTGTMEKYDYLDKVPPEIEAVRREMGFDFGKFDYVEHDGRAILLDANKTPTFRGDRKSERIMRFARAVEGYL